MDLKLDFSSRPARTPGRHPEGAWGAWTPIDYRVEFYGAGLAACRPGIPELFF